MKQIEPWKKCTFIGALLLIALFINSSTNRQKAILQQSRQQVEMDREAKSAAKKIEEDAKEKERKAAEEAAAKFENYLRHYVNSGFSHKTGRKTVALVVASRNGNVSQSLRTELARHFSSDAEIFSSFFTPAFVSDGLFNAIFEGSTDAIRNLKLSDTLDGLLLARQQVQYSTNSALENLITANVHLEIMTLPIGVSGEKQTWSFTANGPGFHTADALQMAEERLIKQISSDTKMSLSEISQISRN
jgi:hypothetical protein